MLGQETVRKKLGARIREVRESKGISTKEFEARDGTIDRHMLSKIENGHRFPSLYTLYQISVILGVDMAELCKGVG